MRDPYPSQGTLSQACSESEGNQDNVGGPALFGISSLGCRIAASTNPGDGGVSFSVDCYRGGLFYYAGTSRIPSLLSSHFCFCLFGWF